VSPSSGIPLRSHPYLLLELLFTIPRASEIKTDAKVVYFSFSPPWKVYWYKCSRLNQNYKNRNTTLPPLASRAFSCLRPNRPISALSCDSSTNADCDHMVPSCLIVSPAHHLCFSEPMRSSPNLVLDGVRAGCEPAPHYSYRRPCSCSR